MFNDLICLALGKTGVGKSSFVNAITGTQNCEVGSKGKACTIDYKIIVTERIGHKIILIDTPGLNDAKGDRNNIKQITNAITDYPQFRCLLILMKFQEVRLDQSIIDTLTKYMEVFPLKNFWEHVIIIRTHAKKYDEDFEDDKKKIEGAIVNSLKDDDFKNFKEFMYSKGIALPYSIKEFYVDCNNDKFERTILKNKKEFDNICYAIKNCSPMFKEIKKNDYQELDKTGKFEKNIHKRQMTFIPYKGNAFTGEPIILREDELCDSKIVNRETRYVYGQVISKCRKKKVHREKYETCFYEIDGQIVKGSECFKGAEWIEKN